MPNIQPTPLLPASNGFGEGEEVNWEFELCHLAFARDWFYEKVFPQLEAVI
jgi:hypothetical protein